MLVRVPSAFDVDTYAVLKRVQKEGFDMLAPARLVALDTCIRSLKSNGIWARLDYLYSVMYTGSDVNFGRVNIRRPGFQLGGVSGVSWLSGNGIGNGGSHMATGFSPQANTNVGASNGDCAFFAYLRTVPGANPAVTQELMTAYDSTTLRYQTLRVRASTARTDSLINDPISGGEIRVVQSGNATANTIYGGMRRTDPYTILNGTPTIGDASSSSIVNGPLNIGVNMSSGWYVGAVWGGRSLTDTMITNMHTIMNTYRAAA